MLEINETMVENFFKDRDALYTLLSHGSIDRELFNELEESLTKGLINHVYECLKKKNERGEDGK